MTKHVTCAALAMVLITGAGVAADRDYDEHHLTVIGGYGVTPFVYEGYSYVPLKSAADFLGATLLWDGLHNRATVVYRGGQLGLVIGSTSAHYMGQSVVLPAAPILVDEQMLVPVIIFDRYFDVPVRWEPEDERVLILGPPGWGYYRVLPSPPPHVIAIIRGYGPPYGRAHGHYPGVYVPAPFAYYGTAYIPLRDVTDVIGAVLLWDHLQNRVLITYGGDEFGLVIGSPIVHYGAQVIVLPAPPVIVGGHVYVPSDFLHRGLKVPVERGDSVLKIKGVKGWRDFKVASSPPGYMYGIQERPHVGVPTRPRPQTERERGAWTRPERPERERAKGPRIIRTQAEPSLGQSGAKKAGGPPAPDKKEAKESKKGGGWFKAKDKAEKNG